MDNTENLEVVPENEINQNPEEAMDEINRNPDENSHEINRDPDEASDKINRNSDEASDSTNRNADEVSNAPNQISAKALNLNEPSTSSNNNNSGQHPALPLQLTTLSMNQLLASHPEVLMHYIIYLQERVCSLETERSGLAYENACLRREAKLRAPANQAQVKQRNPVGFSAPTTRGTSCHITISTGRQMSRSLDSLCHSEPELGNSGSVTPALAGTPLTSTSTPVLSLYSRNGQEEADIVRGGLTSSSSHSIIMLRRPTFLSSQNSTVSIISFTEAANYYFDEVPVVPVERTDSAIVLTPRRSLPSFRTTSFDSVHEDDEQQSSYSYFSNEEFEYPRFPKHERHSWPTLDKYLVMHDFTAQLAVCIDSATSTSNETSEWETEESFVTVSGGLTSGQSQTDNASDWTTDAEEILYDSDVQLVQTSGGYFTSNNQEDEESDQEQSIPEFNPYPMPVVVEHPFQTRLRDAHHEIRDIILLRETTEWNAGLQSDRSVPIGQQVSRRQALLLHTLNGSDREAPFMSRLRSHLYYNVNELVQEADLISPVDEAGTDEALAFVTDSAQTSEMNFEGDEAGSDTGLVNLGDEADLDNQNQDLMEEEPGPEELTEGGDEDSSSSGSESDTGQGDAELGTRSQSSSSTSIQSGNCTGQNTPSWALPSVTNIGGGKYDYLRVTERPRPFNGHRFVVSVFGTTARRNKESRLPSWVPTYAERLECILNQFLHQTGSSSEADRKFRPSVDKIESGGQSEMSMSTGQETYNYYKIRRNTSSIKKLKSCLKVSANEGLIRDPILKVISWSDKVHHLDTNMTSSRLSQEDLNSNGVLNLDTPIVKTRSCPGMYCTENQRILPEGEQQGPNTLIGQSEPSEDLTGIAKTKKKKRFLGHMFRGVCTCNFCAGRRCIVTASSTFSSPIGAAEKNR